MHLPQWMTVIKKNKVWRLKFIQRLKNPKIYFIFEEKKNTNRNSRKTALTSQILLKIISDIRLDSSNFRSNELKRFTNIKWVQQPECILVFTGIVFHYELYVLVIIPSKSRIPNRISLMKKFIETGSWSQFYSLVPTLFNFHILLQNIP